MGVYIFDESAYNENRSIVIYGTKTKKKKE